MPNFITQTGNRGQFGPTNPIVDSVSFRWSFECQAVALTQKKMIVLFLLSNIDRVTMITNFGEFNRKYAISRLLYEISPKVVA